VRTAVPLLLRADDALCTASLERGQADAVWPVPFSPPCDFQVQGAWLRAIPYTLKKPCHTPQKYVMNQPSQRESLQITLLCGPSCTGLLTTLLGSGNTPGIDYGLLAKIQNPWRRRRTLPEGV